MPTPDGYLIAQLSDVHCGDPRFDDQLMLRVVQEINDAQPDLVVVPGDLTADGYEEQFREFVRYIELLDCPQRVVIAGNHDCRNVGYLLFERIVGRRNMTATFDLGRGGDLKLMAVDSNIPDLNDGVIGREKVGMIGAEFAESDAFKVFVLHHHLVSIPETGRERNIVWDAGDVLEALHNAGVDLVLAGHKHVPYIWPIAGVLVVTSGTASSHRTRGGAPASYNLIRIGDSSIEVTVCGSDGSRPTQSFPRHSRTRSARAR